MKPPVKIVAIALLSFVIAASVAFSIPTAYTLHVSRAQEPALATENREFPVSVDPKNKIIIESAEVNAFLQSPSSPLSAAVVGARATLEKVFAWVATSLANAPWYKSLSQVNGTFVTVTPDMRKEQVSEAFASTLKWTSAEKKLFLTKTPDATLPLSEGSYASGTYYVDRGTTPKEAQKLINDRFTNDILSRYSTSTAAVVPLEQALTIASLIERETVGHDDMRLISGIIWNRLFANMNLQLDASLQYAKANKASTATWWPKVLPNDKYLKSPYNTYIHAGLPPTPISNPSAAAVVAALNPLNTPCLYYFHDKSGELHCSDTYAGHVALLKKYYGQGK